MRRTSLLFAFVAAFGLLACPSFPPDTDADPTSPDLPRLPPDIEVEDSLNVPRKDLVDWKQMTAFESGTATLRVTVGNPFGGPHGITGELGVYETTGEELARTAITPDQHNYELDFEVSANTNYFVKIAATRGASPYRMAVTVEVPPPPDPCEGVRCRDWEECREGTCVQVRDPNVCEPECARGMVCVKGKCERPCGGACPRGQVCDTDSNTCRPDPCFGKRCPSGQVCRAGRCVRVTPPTPTPPTPPPAGCTPACGAGETCVNNKCVKEDASGPIRASVLSIIAQGKKTVLVLNKGKNDGVRVGATGRLQGVPGTFTITEVFAFRARAVIEQDDKTVGNNRSATINR